MKKLGNAERGGVIVELDESEWNALRRLMEECGLVAEGQLSGPHFGDEIVIRHWIDAVRAFGSSYHIARQLLINVESIVKQLEGDHE